MMSLHNTIHMALIILNKFRNKFLSKYLNKYNLLNQYRPRYNLQPPHLFPLLLLQFLLLKCSSFLITLNNIKHLQSLNLPNLPNLLKPLKSLISRSPSLPKTRPILNLYINYSLSILSLLYL